MQARKEKCVVRQGEITPLRIARYDYICKISTLVPSYCEMNRESQMTILLGIESNMECNTFVKQQSS